MKDQAESLRKRLAGHERKMNTKAIAIVSGKGGVGKSNISLNFSIALSKRGYRVLLFDMDIGMGNLDILMGKSSDKTIVDYLTGGAELCEVIMDGPEGIKYVGGGSGLNQLVNLSHLRHLAEELDTFLIDYDYLIFDMGAGVNEDSLKFLLSVHEIFVITTSEPTSLMDAYATIKYLHLLDQNLPFYIIANRVQTMKEGQEIFARLSNVMKKFLDREPIYFGVLPDDRLVREAVKNQVPFLIFNPKSFISSSLEDLVNRYIQQKSQERPTYVSISFMSKLKRFFFER